MKKTEESEPVSNRQRVALAAGLSVGLLVLLAVGVALGVVFYLKSKKKISDPECTE